MVVPDSAMPPLSLSAASSDLRRLDVNNSHLQRMNRKQPRSEINDQIHTKRERKNVLNGTYVC